MFPACLDDDFAPRAIIPLDAEVVLGRVVGAVVQVGSSELRVHRSVLPVLRFEQHLQLHLRAEALAEQASHAGARRLREYAVDCPRARARPKYAVVLDALQIRLHHAARFEPLAEAIPFRLRRGYADLLPSRPLAQQPDEIRPLISPAAHIISTQRLLVELELSNARRAQLDRALDALDRRVLHAAVVHAATGGI